MAHRRRYTLDTEHICAPEDEITIEHIDEFVKQWKEYSPKIISVTFEIEDSIHDHS